MPCKDCTKKQGRCDVCWLLDGDGRFKAVIECKTCNANICLDCEKNWLRRGAAYLVRKFG